MMFRKLYWVTEQTDSAGVFRTTGVYTSIQDLIDEGLRWLEPVGPGFRISLVKLDSRGDVLGAWSGPGFSGLDEKIQDYVATGEFAIDECQSLRTALDGFMSPAISR
jgi:hypothetical protein